MHIPDGFLSPPVWAGLGAVSLPAVGFAARRAQAGLGDRRVPMMGLMGAFVFAAQMLNFPVGPGVSGHLLGGALLCYTLGPPAAAVVMTAILTVQAFLFQDGGLLALGANIFNMAIAGVLAAAIPYRYWSSGRLRPLGIFSSGFLSSFVTAGLAISELGLSGVPMPVPILSVSIGISAITAAIEGFLTLSVITALERLNPKLVHASGGVSRPILGILGMIAALMATAGAVMASSLPDGLEHLTGLAGLTDREVVLLRAPFEDYSTLLVNDPGLSKAFAGLAGVVVVFLLCWIAGRWIARWRKA